MTATTPTPGTALMAEADPRSAAMAIVHHLQRYTYRWTTERQLQEGIGDVLANTYQVAPEHALSKKDRPDFWVTAGHYHIAVEVKIRGARTPILQQLGRYAAHDCVDAVILAAGKRALLVGIPPEIHRTPVLVAHTKGPLR